jgi:hypothetical protein
VPLDRVRLTAVKSGLGRHRKLRLARPQGSALVSASDDELRFARPQGSDSASAPEDDELRLARPRARTQPRLRETTNSASPDPRGSDPALSSDDGLRLTRPGARTRPRPRKTDLKGKCALGPFLSILVIECQRKYFCVDLCNVVDKVQIMSKCMFLDLVHCLWTNVLCLSAGNRKD